MISCSRRGDDMTGLEDAKAVLHEMVVEARKSFGKAKEALTPRTELNLRNSNAEAFCEAGETLFVLADKLRLAFEKIEKET